MTLAEIKPNGDCLYDRDGKLVGIWYGQPDGFGSSGVD